MSKNDGWVPQQHGAWAMLAVPSVLGIVASLWLPQIHVTDIVGRALLVLAFLAGYFLFNATSLCIKASPRRRRRYVRPVAAYGAATAVLGVAALGVLGHPVLWWAIIYVPLAVGALALVWLRRERSLASGALTVAAATLFHTVVVRPTWMAGPDLAVAAPQLWVSLLCFLYFFGTVWTVKTMIRQRGSWWWWLASIGYHVAATAVAAVGWQLGALSWALVLFFVATVVKAVVLPRIGPMATPPRSVTPLTVGLVELGFSVALTALLIAWPPLGG